MLGLPYLLFVAKGYATNTGKLYSTEMFYAISKQNKLAKVQLYMFEIPSLYTDGIQSVKNFAKKVNAWHIQSA